VGRGGSNGSISDHNSLGIVQPSFFQNRPMPPNATCLRRRQIFRHSSDQRPRLAVNIMFQDHVTGSNAVVLTESGLVLWTH